MRFALILFALALTLQGCGIRGPLYLPAKPAQPDQPHDQQTPQQEKK